MRVGQKGRCGAESCGSRMCVVSRPCFRLVSTNIYRLSTASRCRSLRAVTVAGQVLRSMSIPSPGLRQALLQRQRAPHAATVADDSNAAVPPCHRPPTNTTYESWAAEAEATPEHRSSPWLAAGTALGHCYTSLTAHLCYIQVQKSISYDLISHSMV